MNGRKKGRDTPFNLERGYIVRDSKDATSFVRKIPFLKCL